MVAGGSISGTVTNSASPAAPVAGICAIVYSAETADTADHRTEGTAITDGAGKYTVKLLRPGTYIVVFSRYCESIGTPGEVFYRQAGGIEGATPVKVVGGQTTTNINAQMPGS